MNAMFFVLVNIVSKLINYFIYQSKSMSQPMLMLQPNVKHLYSNGYENNFHPGIFSLLKDLCG